MGSWCVPPSRECSTILKVAWQFSSRFEFLFSLISQRICQQLPNLLNLKSLMGRLLEHLFLFQGGRLKLYPKKVRSCWSDSESHQKVEKTFPTFLVRFGRQKSQGLLNSSRFSRFFCPFRKKSNVITYCIPSPFAHGTQAIKQITLLPPLAMRSSSFRSHSSLQSWLRGARHLGYT